jgi:hypothetical protein
MGEAEPEQNQCSDVDHGRLFVVREVSGSPQTYQSVRYN